MAGALPDYLASAKPVPLSARQPWYKNTAPTYAGIFLWFVFWDKISENGLGTGGLAMTLLGVFLGAVICHAAFYLVPGVLGMKTGLPLYVVGSSTFGAAGGLIMPGFLMGALQFGWLGVNTYYSSGALVGNFDSTTFYIVCVLWAALAAFMGLKGIQYVAKVATFLPLIPFVVLIYAATLFASSAGGYSPATPVEGGGMNAVLAMIGAIVGFFATAGAAGVDFGMNNRDGRDVNMGGFVGIVLATIFTAGLSVVCVAGAIAKGAAAPGEFVLTSAINKASSASLVTAMSFGLALSAFPGACFSSFIAANSFKTVMPRINPTLSVGIGALVSIILAVTGVAGNLGAVFGLIGASFGPICGAMVADYYLANKRWPGPRAGFNVPGWGAWLVGFLVGITPQLHGKFPAIPAIPAAPVAAFVVGFALYWILTKVGLSSEKLPMPPNTQESSPAAPATAAAAGGEAWRA